MRTLASSFHFAPPVDIVRCALTRGLTAGTLGLPVLPEIAGRVLALANNLNTDIADLCQLIEQDQTLAATVLRYANSAAFAVGEPVVSLHDAMMRMGMTTVSGIALAACLEGREFSTPAYDGYRRRVRTHALVAANLSRDLARRARCNLDMVFMCALMHTIGKPVALRLLTEVQGDAMRPLTEVEAVMLAEEYEGTAAQAALRAWNLPPHVQIAALHYHLPTEAPEFKRETVLTALAGRLATWVTEDLPADEAALREIPEWKLAGFDDGVIEESIELARQVRTSSARRPV
jgi:HD-like signal output (HDOD) protein